MHASRSPRIANYRRRFLPRTLIERQLFGTPTLEFERPDHQSLAMGYSPPKDGLERTGEEHFSPAQHLATERPTAAFTRPHNHPPPFSPTSAFPSPSHSHSPLRLRGGGHARKQHPREQRRNANGSGSGPNASSNPRKSLNPNNTPGPSNRKLRSSRPDVLTDLDKLAKEEREVKSEISRLGLTLRDVEGDGNCLFRALSDQLWGTPNHHPDLRRWTCDWIADNKEEMGFWVQVCSLEGETFEAYVERMRKHGE